MKRRGVILSTAGTVLIAGAIGATVALNQPEKTGADTSPITTQLDSQSKELANHEARITNNENNISALDKNTGTPTTTIVDVPSQAPATTVPDPAPAPTPVTVTAFQQVPLTDGNTDCILTYSDGTTYQWHWEVINPQGSWVTNGVGQNGHWVTTTQTASTCDPSVVGTAK